MMKNKMNKKIQQIKTQIGLKYQIQTYQNLAIKIKSMFLILANLKYEV